MLRKEQLQGLWISVPTEWDVHGEFDEKTFRDEIAMLIAAGAHGLYTTGSTGEYYALDWDEFQKVQAAFLAETAGKIPVQVGANWFNTRDTIRRVRFARDHGADAVQICFPGWMTMRQEDYDQFLVDVYEAVPDIALIHYNVSRTKKVFHGPDYARVLPRVPTLLGSKTGFSVDDYMGLMLHAPQMRHFVGEHVLPLAWQLGCRGSYASWFMMNPTFFRGYYQMCVDGKFAEAIALSTRMARWIEEAVVPLVEKGYMDPTLDKAFVELGGWLPGNRRTRKPHQPLTDEDFAWLKRQTLATMPEFVGVYRP
jgi:dihydrodipicolinate synthase/N-acetylneuraminate lyase